jgi:predicted dehydrogenase
MGFKDLGGDWPRRVLIAGYGRMGSNHARVLRKQGHDVFTVDPDPVRGADHRSIPREADPDIALVSVPPHLLAEVARELISVHEVPLLVLDKPMATTLEDAQRINALALSRGTEIRTVFTERANPGFRALRDCMHLVGPVHHIAARRFGPPPANWDCDVGVDIAGHCFDMARALGFEPEPIWAAAENGSARYRSLISGGDGVLDVQVSHEGGEKLRTFNVTGPGGMLNLDKATQTLLFFDDEGATEIPVAREEPLQIAWREITAGTWDADGTDGEIALGLSLARRDRARDTR